MRGCTNIEPLQPVTSISELCQKAPCSRRHRALVFLSADRLGGTPQDAREAAAFLMTLAEDDEASVLAVVNSIRSEV